MDQPAVTRPGSKTTAAPRPPVDSSACSRSPRTVRHRLPNPSGAPSAVIHPPETNVPKQRATTRGADGYPSQDTETLPAGLNAALPTDPAVDVFRDPRFVTSSHPPARATGCRAGRRPADGGGRSGRVRAPDVGVRLVQAAGQGDNLVQAGEGEDRATAPPAGMTGPTSRSAGGHAAGGTLEADERTVEIRRHHVPPLPECHLQGRCGCTGPS